jgi:plastocyanin
MPARPDRESVGLRAFCVTGGVTVWRSIDESRGASTRILVVSAGILRRGSGTSRAFRAGCSLGNATTAEEGRTMTNKTWFTLAAGYALLAAGPALAEGHTHEHGSAKAQTRNIEVAVTSEGFVPAEIHVKKGEKVNLVVTRKTERTCATAIVIKDLGVKHELPLDKAVTVAVRADRKGKLRYACPMDMIAGDIVVD